MSLLTETEPTNASPDEEQDDRRVVITLTSAPAAYTRRLAHRTGVSIPEVVRRALAVLQLVVSLDADEELVIRNRRTKEIERVRFQWTED